jgi:hypothetical protein
MKIEKHYKIPSQVYRGRKIYPFSTMEIGESFFIPEEKKVSAANAASGHKKRNKGFDYTIRKVESGYRLWRIA